MPKYLLNPLFIRAKEIYWKENGAVERNRVPVAGRCNGAQLDAKSLKNIEITPLSCRSVC